MSSNAMSGEDWEVSGRLWRFGQCEFEESSRELRVNGKVIELESKPVEVLYQLLLHAGEVVTKEELLDAVWPGVSVVDGSLATAVSKLRKALGEAGAPIVLTVPRIGYRLGVSVQCQRMPAPSFPQLGFQPGDLVPGRPQWQLLRQLDASGSSEVWLAEQSKTGESRVFKFASEGIRLKGLKREVTLSRLLRSTLGDRPEFVRTLEWNFDAAPFYLESEYGGQNLIEWADARGGLDTIPLGERLLIVAEVAEAVAAAHKAGVLHKDLKPANILVAPKPDGGWHVKVADFGCGSLVQPEQLAALGITNLGFTQTEIPPDHSLTGTLMYLAPEVLAGQSPTAAADVYALGVLLYQLIAGDFRRPLSPGWEAEVEDPLLREDVAEAASGDPGRRLGSVAVLAERLRSLEARRAARSELERARAQAEGAERHLAVERARRPWVLAAGGALAAGLAVSLVLFGRASSERDRADRETDIAQSVSSFLADDLLGRTDPFVGKGQPESLADAVKQAAPMIDQQFPEAPEVAARLHQTIARALDSRSDWGPARKEYAQAAKLFRRAQGPLSQDAIVVQLQRAAMEARTYQKGSLVTAKALLAEQESRLDQIPRPRPDLAVWKATARGMIALIDNDIRTASAQFQAAYDLSAGLPKFDERARLTMKQRLAFTNIRLGNGVRAEKLFRELIAEFSRLDGPDSPAALRIRLNLAQAFMIQEKYRDAIRETTSLYPKYVAKLGADHEFTLQLLATRAQSEASLSMWKEAIADDLKAYETAVRKQGPMTFFSIATLSDAALAQCRSGSYRDGEANAVKAFEASLKGFGPRAGLTGGSAYTVATCWIGIGKLAPASKLLAQIDPKEVARLTGYPDWFANVDLAKGEIAFKQGDYAAARKFLSTAAPVFSRPGAEAYQKHAAETLAAALEKHHAGG